MIGQNEIFFLQAELLKTLYDQGGFGKKTLIYGVGANPTGGKRTQGPGAPQSKFRQRNQKFQNRQYKERGAPENGIAEIDNQ